MNMCHDSIPHAESYQPNFGTICTINHICSNAYPQPKGLWINGECSHGIKHELNVPYVASSKNDSFFLHKQSSIIVTKHRSLSF